MNDSELQLKINLLDTNEPKEVEVPSQRETFEAQVLVISKPYKKMEYPYAIDAMGYDPMRNTRRTLSGKYRLELVMSSIANGKPTLIIHEE